MGALLGVASQLRPPRVSVGFGEAADLRVFFVFEGTNEYFTLQRPNRKFLSISKQTVARALCFPQIDTNSSVKRESATGNASLSQLLLTSPFGSNDNARFTASDALSQSSANNVDMDAPAPSTGQVGCIPPEYHIQC